MTIPRRSMDALDDWTDADLSESERLRAALQLMATGFRLKRASLRRQHPDATLEELEAMFQAWVLEGD